MERRFEVRLEELLDDAVLDPRVTRGIPYFPHFSPLFSANFTWARLAAVRIGGDA